MSVSLYTSHLGVVSLSISSDGVAEILGQIRYLYIIGP